MNIRQLQAIDIHTHFNSGSPDDVAMDDLYCCTPASIRQEYDACNIGCGGFSSFASVCTVNDVPGENEKAAQLAAQLPWFFQWVVVNPFDEDTYDHAERLLASPKSLGLKLHPSYHGYNLGDYGDRIFSFAAQRKATVLMHPDYMELVPDFANRYPDCNIIVAHVGSYQHIECIQAARHGNVYTDTSGSASLRNQIIEYAVHAVGAEKILFGTDTYACAAQRGRIEYARITDTEKTMILRDNALRLFPQLGCCYE